MKQQVIFQLSDLHLSGKRAYNYANWAAALDHVNKNEADLVVISGDVCLDDPDCEADHQFARAELQRINKNWRLIAGNDDVGDSGHKPYRGQNINQDRLARFARIFGASYWAERLGEWLIVGIDSMLCSSNLVEEAGRNFTALRHILDSHHNRPVMLFLHKPLFINHVEEDVVSHWYVTPLGRRRLREVLQGANIRIIASGHTHHHRTLMRESILYVWAPAVGHIDFSDKVPFHALPMAAMVRYELAMDGSKFTLIVPQGMITWNAEATIKASGSFVFCAAFVAHRRSHRSPAIPPKRINIANAHENPTRVERSSDER